MYLLLKTKHRNKESGFTLIELLVVISIIGLLSSIVLTSVSIIRYKARDSKRVQDLQTIASALELYYLDNGTYPAPPADYWSSESAYNGNATYGWQNLQSALAPYLPKLPVDPINNGGVVWNSATAYTYQYGHVGKNAAGKDYYSLIANLEDPNSPLRCSANSYKWHYHNSGVLLCNNGGPSGWSYSLAGYQASRAQW